jgi:hypothetical protein
MIAKLFYFAQECGAPAAGKVIGRDCLPEVQADGNTLNTLFMIGFVTIGALAAFMMVIAGIRYITAGGDAQKIQTAKNEIKYALIGLVIAGTGAAVVNFIINRL